MDKLFKTMYQLILDKIPFIFITIVSGKGSTPRGAGANMIVKADGECLGTIGGGAVEFEAQKYAQTLFENKQSTFKHYHLTKNQAADLGMVCGGELAIYFHYVEPSKENELQLEKLMNYHRVLTECWLIIDIDNQNNGTLSFQTKAENKALKNISTFDKTTGYKYCQPIIKAGKVYIFGGGHIARNLVPLLQHVFFECVVIDSDENFINDNDFPTLQKKIICPFADISKQIEFQKEDYVVIATRGHLYDAVVLAQVINLPLTYIGMIGSRQKIKATYQKLINENNVSKERLDWIKAPIGLPLGGSTPEEIAVSITAQLIRERYDYARENK